ncbi:hypothetical protein OUZ56_032972 [Daphnia magna]|uniref:Uncharacterized protein n=1 Tax=Daphnia magna TaxID=35525 RepID=A0ABR0AZA5_9CRUS|nr:hypothetical protein OUZ56_023516 [Daphnia magna]KAK4045372.1 hypothetical protein OUZ56_032972 [Daphnia magna]
MWGIGGRVVVVDLRSSKHAARTETMEKKVTQRRQDKLFLMLYSHEYSAQNLLFCPVLTDQEGIAQ